MIFLIIIYPNIFKLSKNHTCKNETINHISYMINSNIILTLVLI